MFDIYLQSSVISLIHALRHIKYFIVALTVLCIASHKSGASQAGIFGELLFYKRKFKFFFFFFFMNGNTERAQCALSQVCIPKKRKRKVMKRIKQIYKISKRVRKKKSCHLVSKVVIDLPFEGRKVEGSWKYRRRERVPKAGSRREEAITELINSCIGEFHTIVVGK